MDPRVEKVKEPLPYRKLKVTVSSLGGVRITGFLSLPVQGEDPAGVKRWPVIVTTCGYGGAQQGVMLGECMRGFAVLQVFPRGQGASAGDYTIKGGDKLTMELDRPEGAYYQGAYADVIRMIDFVMTRKDLDSGRIALVATSQGGGVALCVAALDSRVRTVVAHVPFLCDMPLAARMPSLVKHLLDRAGKNNAHSLATLEYFDPYQLAPRLHIPVLLSAGGKDHICPKQTIESVYQRLPGKKRLIEYPNLVHTTCLDFYQRIWPWLDRYLGIAGHKHLCG
jgi:cephalosporin-C deacetylase